MSTKTTKPKISEESRKKIESFKTTQQLYNDLDEYIRNNKKTTDRAKTRLAKQIGELGKEFVEEIEQDKYQEEELYKEYAGKVEFIIKTCGEKYGSLELLNNMTYQQIDSIYDKALSDSKKGFWGILLDFVMGW